VIAEADVAGSSRAVHTDPEEAIAAYVGLIRSGTLFEVHEVGNAQEP
jgi:hypothetical protein